MTTPIVPRDLGKQAPHSPRHRLDGFAIASRTVDKCRAKAAGTMGEYQYAGPLDQLLFSFKGITSEQFSTAAQAAKNYEDVGAWLHQNGTPKTAEQIRTWSDTVEAANPMKNPESRSRFIENCHRLGLNPEMNSTFDWLEADDRETFRRQSG